MVFETKNRTVDSRQFNLICAIVEVATAARMQHSSPSKPTTIRSNRDGNAEITTSDAATSDIAPCNMPRENPGDRLTQRR